MKYLLFTSLFFFQLGIAQRHEIGARIGSSHIVGDIGKTNYIRTGIENITTQIPIHIGVSYKRNFNPYQGIKFSATHHSVSFNDKDAKEFYRNNRKINNINSISELALTFEYNFFPINNEVRESMWSPYIFAGGAGIIYDVYSIHYEVIQRNNQYNISSYIQNPMTRVSWAIPFGIGLKYKFNYNWAIYGELTFRPTLTDDLDYNNIKNMDYSVFYRDIPEIIMPQAVEFFNQYIQDNTAGNLHSKDWLNSISLGISYSFGRPPCNCD